MNRNDIIVNNRFQFYSKKEKKFIKTTLSVAEELFDGLDGYNHCKTLNDYKFAYHVLNSKENNQDG